MTSTLDVTHGDGTTVIALNRPEARNAFNPAVWAELTDELSRARAEGVRAVVLTGNGRFFSAGGDVKAMPAGGGQLAAPVVGLSGAHEAIRCLARLPMPVIVAVEGFAIGAAWGLVLAGDLVIAGRSSFFQAPFAARGLVADAGTAWQLTRRIGQQRTMQILLTGRRVPAPEARDLGLVSEVVDDGAALSTARELAATVAAGPPESNALTKSLVRKASDLDLESFLQLEWVSAALAHQGADAREGRQAFAEKRDPRFGGGR